jgi:hypothetical protein
MLIFISTASAQDQSVVVPPQLAAPAEAQPAPPMPAPTVTNGAEPMPGPVATTAAAVHPTPPISYHAGLRARRMLNCNPEVKLVMVAKNPIDCCLYEIPLCVPACCEGQPAMSEGRGIFGRGIVEYCWPCGFKATVKFRPVLCDVKVDYTVN